MSEQVLSVKAENPDVPPLIKPRNLPMEEEAASCNASFNLPGLQMS
jgi:hypothetical protein